jgi:hypothetical protein
MVTPVCGFGHKILMFGKLSPLADSDLKVPVNVLVHGPCVLTEGYLAEVTFPTLTFFLFFLRFVLQN